MQWLMIALSSLLTIIAPVGLVLDTILADRIRSQVAEVEELAVRVDNVPAHQALDGQVDRVRIASRGIYPLAGLRIEALELESDPLDINIERLQQGGKNGIREALRQPAQVAIRLEVKEEDLNKALNSPEIKAKLQTLIDKLVPERGATDTRLELLHLNLEFVADNRLRTQIQLQQSNSEGGERETLDVDLEVGLNIVSGRVLQLVNPTGSLNGRKLATKLLNGFARGLNEQLDLSSWEKDGFLVRILQFSLDEESLNLATFVRVEPATGKPNN